MAIAFGRNHDRGHTLPAYREAIYPPTARCGAVIIC
jgi:hypothetical protein